MFKWFCWESIKYGTAHMWLDSPKLISTVQVENYLYLHNWKRPLWIYAGKCGSVFLIAFVFGWLHRTVTLDFMRGVTDSDLAKLKKEVLNEISWAKQIMECNDDTMDE